MALKTKPSITPKIRRVVVLCILEETSMTRAELRRAPTKAAETTVNPDKAAGRELPMIRVAIAAPVPAPALTPMM